MMPHQAKEILRAYRPWAKDAQDPEVAEALAVGRADPELAMWLARHGEVQTAVRAQLQGIQPPAGLAPQIVAEWRAQVARRTVVRRRLAMTLAGVAIVISGWFIWSATLRAPREDLSFSGYRSRMARTAVRAYGMDLETNDGAVIRAHLAANQAPVEYVIAATLQETAAVGCGVLRWQNKPVTMVCFRTGQPLGPGRKSDLILFVARQQDVNGGAVRAEPQFSKVSEWFTASWRTGDLVYLLAAFDEAELRKRL